MQGIARYTVLGAFALILFFIVHQLKRDYRKYRESYSSYVPIPEEKVTEKKSFVVLIASFCNEKYVERNLRSVFEQEYDAYRVIYIDDFSTDRTMEKAKEVTESYEMGEKVTFIRNPRNIGQVANYYYAIKSCRDDEIIVTLDGDDWFAHTKVLSQLNQYYNDANIWLTYGQIMSYPDYRKYNGKEPHFNRLKTGKVRSHWHCLRYNEWIFCCPRTFYAGLFKKIKIRDLFFEGGIVKVGGDTAFMYPLLEMARGHSAFIPDITYIYNQETPLSDEKIRRKKQKEAAAFFFSKKPYPALLENPRELKPIARAAPAPLILFSSDGPIRLEAFIQSLEKWVDPIGEVYVLFESSSADFDLGYRKVQEEYPIYSYINLAENGPLKEILCTVLKNSPSKHAVLAHDQMLIKEEIDLNKGEDLLEATGASGVYFQLGANITPPLEKCVPIGSGAFTWQFIHAKGPWSRSNNVEMTLYPKEEVLRMVQALSPKSISDFLLGWIRGTDTQGIGLCFGESKAVDLKICLSDRGDFYSNEELNKRFLEGYRLNIETLSKGKNREIIVECHPEFNQK